MYRTKNNELLQRNQNLMKNNKTNSRSNLTQKEHQMLKTLTEDLRFIIFMAEKNLGPCIMERENDIQKALKENLEKGNAYSMNALKNHMLKTFTTA